MNIKHIPLYCGGALVLGLYKQPNIIDPKIDSYRIMTSEEVYKESIDFQNKIKSSGGTGNSLFYDGQCVNSSPNDLKTFARLLRDLVQISHSSVIGTLIAVTNPTQSVAAKNLEECGFVPAIKTYKIANEVFQTQSYIDAAGCVTWIGNFQKVVRPKLNEIIENK